MPETVEERPGPAKVSGWMWIVFAGLMLLGWLGTVATAPGEESVIATLQLIPGAVIFYVGLQTIRARAKDTLGNGIGSILIGLMSFGQAQKSAGGTEALLILLVSVYLMLAGILALVGRQQYKQWRDRRHPPQPPETKGLSEK